MIRRAGPDDMAEIGRLCWAYRALLVARAGGIPGLVETYYAHDTYAALIADLPRIHARPKGDIILSDHGGRIMGCAMYYPLGPDGVTEIKRVFVDPAARGLGVGKALMVDAMQRAAADGYKRMVLDTMAPLTEAIALYAQLGFATCPPYYTPDPAYLPHLRFFDIALEERT